MTALHIFTLLLLASVVHGDHHEQDDDSCGCLAAVLGFTINCNAQAFIVDAYNALAGCTTSTCVAGNACYRNFIIVQAHHDHCPPSSFPTVVQQGFHTYEEVCGEGCYIGRQFIASQRNCPAPVCNNSATVTAAVSTLQASCTSDCNSTVCRNAWGIVRANHDGCDELSVPEVAEEAVHDFEDICNVVECNTVTAAFNPNTCGPNILTPPDNSGVVNTGTDSHGRLFLTDNIDNEVFTYDFDSGTWSSAAVPGIAPGSSLPTSTMDGRYVVVTSRGGDMLQFMDSGMRIIYDAHGSTVVRGLPQLEAATFSAESPGHVESSYGWVVIFFDGSLGVAGNSPAHKGSLAVAFPESQLGLPIDQVQPRVIFRDFAQHGNAWPTGGCNFMRSVSANNPPNSLPNSFQLVDVNGNVLQDFPNVCVGFHGYALINGYEVIGCNTRIAGGGNVVAFQYQPSTRRSIAISTPYPHDNRRVSTMYANPGMDYAIGNYAGATGQPSGNEAIIRVNPRNRVFNNNTDILFFPRTAWADPLPAGVAQRSVCTMDMQKGGNNLMVVVLPDGYMYLYRSDDFSAAPVRIDLFPENRPTTTRAQYACTGPRQVRMEVGVRYAFVVRPGFNTTQAMRIDLLLGTVDALLPLPAGISGTASIGDMVMVVPSAEPSDQVCSIATGSSGGGVSTTASPSGSNTSGSSNDSNEKAVIALAVIVGVALLALVILGVLFVQNSRKNLYSLMKHQNSVGTEMGKA